MRLSAFKYYKNPQARRQWVVLKCSFGQMNIDSVSHSIVKSVMRHMQIQPAIRKGHRNCSFNTVVLSKNNQKLKLCRYNSCP